MRKFFLLILLTNIQWYAISQDSSAIFKESLLKELSGHACKCIDSIQLYNKSREQVVTAINKCLNEQIVAYQLSSKLLAPGLLKNTTENDNEKKEVNISVNTDEDSKEYKKYYYEFERYMMVNCNALKEKVATNEKQSSKSFSNDPKALEYYSSGLDEVKKENYKKAVKYFEKAVKIDPQFAFAWDNMGIAYRKLDDYDKALEAYQNSLAIDSNGLMPLQNIAVVYQYKKDYQKALTAYSRLAAIDSNNPEVYYGIGLLYTLKLKELEKGLSNLCKAYNLYLAQKSPYRTDAERVINMIYAEMKQQGKEELFKATLKEHHISPE